MLFYKYFVPLARLPSRLVVPQRGKIFIGNGNWSRNRPCESLFQNIKLLSDGTASAFKKQVP
ncbi:MAG: hypothetical protein C0397_04850 [Odoribacter sp.]|nr:hypothetical protein [Odoribacter sp.]